MNDAVEPLPPQGALHLVGRLIEASNATFVATDDAEVRWVYKPVAGEAPLWDFPAHTLGRREVAAYELSRAGGFGVVPDTYFLDAAPLGPGSVQRWIDISDTELVRLVAVDDVPNDWFGIVVGVDAEDHDVALVHADDQRLRRLAIFDIIANNADRKAGHILLDAAATPNDGHSGRVFGVDHGVTFHPEPKLRTVLWGWSGDPLSDAERHLATAALEVASGDALTAWLSSEEIEATCQRASDLLAAGVFPEPGDTWPAIPWPPI